MAKREKTTRFSIQTFDNSHYQQTEQYTRMVNDLFDIAIKEVSEAAVRGEYDPDKPFVYRDYPKIQKQIDKITSKLAANITTVIETGSEKQWLFACKKNDAFIDSIFDTSKLRKSMLKQMKDRNLDALHDFQERKVNGMNLSQRVWNYCGQYKEQLEFALDVGLGEGRSAQQLARDVKQNLVEPNRLFRRVRDKRGNLVLSKAAKAYHPGRGVYRSSVKNAQRLTRSEINMAYRESDYRRWQQLDFVVGIEIRRSGHVPLFECDVCEPLVGKYPKTFKFVGWHPQCMCYAIPVMADFFSKESSDDRVNEMRAALHGTEYKKYTPSETVTDVPEGFKKWVEEHKNAQKNWATTPYFIRDNFKNGLLKDGLHIVPIAHVIAKTFGIDYNLVHDAMEWYVGGDGMFINQFLRGKSGFSPLTEDETELLKQLTELTSLEGVKEEVLWRSVNADVVFGQMSDMDWEAMIDYFVYDDKSSRVASRVQRFINIKGREFTEKGFMSTTRSQKVAHNWGDYTGSDHPIVMKIRTNKNTKGFDVERYTKIHNSQTEEDDPQQEVLLARNQRYKVVNVYTEEGRIYVEVELLDDSTANVQAVKDVRVSFVELSPSKQAHYQAVFTTLLHLPLDLQDACSNYGVNTSSYTDLVNQIKAGGNLLYWRFDELKAERMRIEAKVKQAVATGRTRAVAIIEAYKQGVNSARKWIDVTPYESNIQSFNTTLQYEDKERYGDYGLIYNLKEVNRDFNALIVAMQTELSTQRANAQAIINNPPKGVDVAMLKQLVSEQPSDAYPAVLIVQDLKDEIKKITKPIILQHYTTDAEVNETFKRINEGLTEKWFEHGDLRIDERAGVGCNGSTDMFGRIHLTKTRLALVKSALGKIGSGKSETITRDEADAMATFWHEITHNRNIPGNFFGKADSNALQTRNMELANEFVARHTLPEFYGTLGVKNMPHPEFMVNRSSTGYNTMVMNYDFVIVRLNLDHAKVLASVRKHLFTAYYKDQQAGLIQALHDGGIRKLNPKEKIKVNEMKELLRYIRGGYPTQTIEIFLKSHGFI